MSWKLGKSKKATLTADRDDAASTRSITPTPGDDKPHFRTGILSIRVLWAEALSVPQGTSGPCRRSSRALLPTSKGSGLYFTSQCLPV
jgi:serum/glucocorticoid-regulated kinase 2